MSVVAALVNIGAPALDPLIQALRDNSATMRTLAARGLGLLGDQRAVTSLTAALKDQNEQVKRAAAEALRKLSSKTPAALGSLIS